MRRMRTACLVTKARDIHIICNFFLFGATAPRWATASSFTRFLDHTQRRASRWMISPSQKPLPDNIQHSQQKDIHDRRGIRTHNLSRRAAVDLRLRPLGHWDRPEYVILTAFPLRPCLHERASMSRLYSHCLSCLAYISFLRTARGRVKSSYCQYERASRVIKVNSDTC